MGSIINDKTLSLNNQMTSGSRSALLLNHVKFELNQDDDDLMSAKCLQNKYNVLSVDNNNDFTIKTNGQNKCSSNSSSNLLNGNISDNTDGIPVSKHTLYPRERVRLEWKEPHKIGAGIANLGNTCFMNSVLQCLSYCPPLVNYLLHSDDDHSIKCNANFCMTCEMTKHVRLALTHSGDTIKPINICRRLKSIAKHFTFGRQEDAHEFLRYVIDNMWRSCLAIHELNMNSKLDPLSKETTAINQIFGGYHRSQVQCFQCNEKSNTYDYFMDFMLDIKNVLSLDKALDKFVAAEILQNDNAYKCPRCKKKVLAKKQFTVYKAPNVATFQLKRFDYNRMYGGKITKSISYPEKLNLRPYMSDNKGPPILYRLNSVLVHLGPTCNSGHYFCYVRNSNGFWYLMDDSRVVQVNLNQVMNQQAYVLFYVRIDTDFHKPNPVKNYISNPTPHGVKLSNISSPEMISLNQKLNYSVHNGSYASVHNSFKPNSLKTIPYDGIKHPQSLTKKKPNSYESSSQSIKGLVPYASDSSDEEISKQTTITNGNIDCDKDKGKKLSTAEHKPVSDNEEQKCKAEKVDNNCHRNGSISCQNIPISKMNSNNNLNESICTVPLAPITLKVKATTSSWHVVETALLSPSVASGSSTNSVNSTTEWTISECLPECNPNQHSKHHKHRNKHNRCATALTNGNVNQVISTKTKIPHNSQDFDKSLNQPKLLENSIKLSESQNHTIKKWSDSRFIISKSDSKLENGLISKESKESNESKCKDPTDTTAQREQFDRRSISSHRSSNDSKDSNNKNERNHIKSHKSYSSCSDQNSTTSNRSHDKKKHRKHKHCSNHSRKISDSDSECETKSKHKKKRKQKKKKHRKRSSSDSDSIASNDNQLQWVERTKETVDRERISKSSEKEIYTKDWDENVGDLANKKRKYDESNDELTNGNESNNNNAETLNCLLKNSFRGYGDKVNSWNGGPNNLNDLIDKEKRNVHNYDDDYDEDYDRGKTKKIKNERSENCYHDSNHNPFQKFQSHKHRNNGSFNYFTQRPNYDKHLKTQHNSYRSWKPHHKRYDNDRRH